jgi:hypothetical protein
LPCDASGRANPSGSQQTLGGAVSSYVVFKKA